MKRLLFVCMGNICRSPLAEGFARSAAAGRGVDVAFDSAGTEDYHVCDPPDVRARAIARAHGVDIDMLRARQVQDDDFRDFDVILAADRRNLQRLDQRRPANARAELGLLLEWCGAAAGTELPDPYYGGEAQFAHVVALLREAMPGLLDRLLKPPDQAS